MYVCFLLILNRDPTEKKYLSKQPLQLCRILNKKNTFESNKYYKYQIELYEKESQPWLEDIKDGYHYCVEQKKFYRDMGCYCRILIKL